MKVWFCNELVNVELGERFFVGRCGSGRTVFGENATLTKVTNNHMIFTTDSGAIVKTKRDYLSWTIGKAAKEHYWVGFERDIKADENIIEMPVHYWDSKKCIMTNK